MPCLQVEEAVELIQMEYAGMPGLKLTFWQAQRLWNLSSELCDRALTVLTRSGFLVQEPDGAYVRRCDQPVSIEVSKSLAPEERLEH